jgi:hypothetical protein
METVQPNPYATLGSINVYSFTPNVADANTMNQLDKVSQIFMMFVNPIGSSSPFSNCQPLLDLTVCQFWSRDFVRGRRAAMIGCTMPTGCCVTKNVATHVNLMPASDVPTDRTVIEWSQYRAVVIWGKLFT